MSGEVEGVTETIDDAEIRQFQETILVARQRVDVDGIAFDGAGPIIRQGEIRGRFYFVAARNIALVVPAQRIDETLPNKDEFRRHQLVLGVERKATATCPSHRHISDVHARITAFDQHAVLRTLGEGGLSTRIIVDIAATDRLASMHARLIDEDLHIGDSTAGAGHRLVGANEDTDLHSTIDVAVAQMNIEEALIQEDAILATNRSDTLDRWRLASTEADHGAWTVALQDQFLQDKVRQQWCNASDIDKITRACLNQMRTGATNEKILVIGIEDQGVDRPFTTGETKFAVETRLGEQCMQKGRIVDARLSIVSVVDVRLQSECQRIGDRATDVRSRSPCDQW